MLPSITENPNWVGGQKNTQVSSGDCDTSIDTTLCGRWGKRGKEEEEVEEGGGEVNHDPTFQMRTIIKLIA